MEFHCNLEWRSPDGRGGRHAGLAVEAPNREFAEQAFEEWARRGDGRNTGRSA